MKTNVQNIITKSANELTTNELRFIREDTSRRQRKQLSEGTTREKNTSMFTMVALAMEARTKTYENFSEEMQLLLRRLYG